MTRYVKKPIVIEAVRWRGYANNLGITVEPPDTPLEITDVNPNIKWEPIPDWMPTPLLSVAEKETPAIGEIVRDGEHLLIGTLEGIMRAEKGDWIIRGIKGEIYPCKPDIFAATYELWEPKE